MAGDVPTTSNSANVKLGDVITNFDSKRIPLSSREREQRRGEYPYYGAAGCIDSVDNYLFDGLYLLVGEDGSVVHADGSPYLQLVSGKFWVNNHAHVLQGKDFVETRYLYYAIMASNISGLVTGAVQPKLNQANLNSIEVYYPLRLQRERVVEILGALDDKIELNRKMNATLEQMARALFQSWFVDFDPVHAKAAGRQPIGMDKATADLFPHLFVDSELGKIPKGWETSSIGAKLKTILGGTPSRAKTEYWEDGTIAWINSGKTNDFRIIEPSELITKDALQNSATKLLPSRTTVLAITGATLGQVSIAEIECCANQSVIAILASEQFPTEFIYPWIKENIGVLIASQTGGAQQHINKGNVDELLLLCPDYRIVNAYQLRAKPIFDKIALNCFQSQNLAELRDTLLPKLLSGELSVK